MLGRPCPFRNECRKYKTETSLNKQMYCESTNNGWERCAQYPGNANKPEIQQEYKNAQAGQGLGALLILGLIIFGALKLFGVI